MGKSTALFLGLSEALGHSYYPSDRLQAPRMHLRSWRHYHGLAARTRKKACLSSQLLWAARSSEVNPPILALIQVSLKFREERLKEEQNWIPTV